MKYILGGGIAGLIFGYYNRDFTIIDGNPGGQMNNDFPLGPRLLQVTEHTQKLMDDIGMNPYIKPHVVGFWDENKFHSRSPSGFKEKYFYKTRGISPTYMPESTMSDDKNTIDSFDIDFNSFTEQLKLLLSPKFYRLNVSKIDLMRKLMTLSDGTILDYEEIVSTIPLPLLCKLCDIKLENDFSTLSKTFLLTTNFRTYANCYDYIYYVGRTYHRVTKWKGFHIVEFTGYDQQRIEDICEAVDYEVVNIKHIPRIQIQHSLDSKATAYWLERFDGISLIGRFGQWDHRIKTQDVVRYAIERRG